MKKLVAILLVLVLCVSVCTYAEESWKCPNCGEENGADCAFCENCGAKHVTEWICAVCGKTNTKNFCGGCGAAKPENNSAAYKVGDIVTLGTYAGEPIEWQVMEDKGDGTCVLLSVKSLDARPYNRESTKVTWETCSLRAWLNGEFYETSFSESEKGQIVLSSVETPDNKYGTEGGNTTQDYVYLLSLDEVGRYFNVDPHSDDTSEALICFPTAYAKNNGAYTNDEGACWWWLRSPGSVQSNSALVRDSGSVTDCGNYVSSHGCVRPAICVRF